MTMSEVDAALYAREVDRLTRALATERSLTARLRGALEELAAIGDALSAQDNRCTSLPVFMVQRHRRTYGFDPQYTEDCVAWLYSDECVEVTDEEFERLEAKWDESGDEPDGYTRTAYQDTWGNVMPFFTEQAAQRYIKENGHNLSSPRVYVESGYRNHEWNTIRKACIEASRALSTPPAAAPVTCEAPACTCEVFTQDDRNCPRHKGSNYRAWLTANPGKR
jgi:hypothetical protein